MVNVTVFFRLRFVFASALSGYNAPTQASSTSNAQPNHCCFVRLIMVKFPSLRGYWYDDVGNAWQVAPAERRRGELPDLSPSLRNASRGGRWSWTIRPTTVCE